MKYPSDLDYDRDQEPTPLQEIRQKWQDDVAYYQEQISNAVVLLRDALHPPSDIDSLGAFHDSICNWLAQNTTGKVKQ